MLRAEGLPVRALVRNPGKAGPLEALGAEVVVADIGEERHQDSLNAAAAGVAGIYHIAALFRQQGVPDEQFYRVNRDGVQRLIEAAIAAGGPRVVHCSTVGVLGHIAQPPADESTPYNPGDIYQVTKMEGEKTALQYFREGRVPGVVIRPAMIYGPGDARTLKLFRMIARRRFFYVGRGEALVHWIDVRDLCRAFQLAMQATVRNGEIYIIAGECAMALRAMCEEVAGQMGVKPPSLCIPVKPMQWAGSLCEALCRPFGIEPPLYRRRVDFFTKSRHFDASKAREELGFTPAQSFPGEIADILAAYREAGEI